MLSDKPFTKPQTVFMKVLSAWLAILSMLFVAGCNKSSTTSPTPLPVVPTIPVLAGTSTSAYLTATTVVITGSITSDGGSAITARGVCWGTSSNPLVTGNHTTDGSGTGSFSSTITALIPQTAYYARIYATNSLGTVYGNQLNFTTGIPDVFVVGYEENGTYSNARIWKNGMATTLSTPPTKQSWGRGVYVVKDDVYAVGYEFDGINYTAKLWKNNVSTSLSNGVLDAQAFGVFVSGDDVYIAGYQNDASGSSVATLWKNGVPRALPGGSNNGQATSVLVSGSDVYVTGYNGSVPSVAKLWKNGVAADLPGLNPVAYSVSLSDTDVYVAGGEFTGGIGIATVWKNGVASFLSNGNQIAIAYGTAVLKNDLYVAGFEVSGGNGIARVWKNGVASSLTNGANYARSNSVYIIGDDVYVTGYERINNVIPISIAKTWKNGVNIYSSNGTFNASGFSIFVR